MKKTLGQNGLNFIANKYKELKTALSHKVDNSQITDVYDAGDEELIPSLKALSELGKSLRRDLDRKVYKVSGKGLSANDYTDSDKAKVDAIPTNPKYTDTITEVVDNLTTSDSTKALSAKQGKTLNDSLSGKADKSNIGRCKTKGYSSASSWSSVSSSRDLEDWIGDFDKRTRELKNSGKGLTGDSSEFKVQQIECNNTNNVKLMAVRWGRIIQLNFDYVYESRYSTDSFWKFTLPKEFVPAGIESGIISNGEFEILPKNDFSDANMMVRKSSSLSAGRISGIVMYFAKHREY